MLPTQHAPGADKAAAAGKPALPEGPPATQGWLRIIGATVGRALVMFVVTTAAWAALPAVIGWQSTTVVSGSMEPAIAVGDVVVVKPVGNENLTTGRVVLAEDPDHAGRLRLHRIAAVDPDGSLVLRGDANAADDSSSVWPSAVRGVGYLRVPAAGLPIVWIGNGQWPMLAAFAGALTGALALTWLDRTLVQGRRRKDTKTGGRPRSGAKNRMLPGGHPAAVMVVLSVSAGLAGATMLAAPVSHATFSGSSSNPANTFASRPFFSCTAAVTANSPSLFFAFNDSPTPATAVTDSSGNATNGAFRTTSALSTAVPCSGDAGKSADLAGARYISTSGTAKAGPTVFSYEMWFKTTSSQGGKLGGFQDSQTGATGTNDRNLYMRADGKLVFGVAPGGSMQTITSPAAYNNGSWHHAAVTLSSAGMKLYVDGTSVASAAGVTTARSGYTGWWRFGDGTLAAWPGAGTSAFNGQMDNIAAYNTVALTPAQLLAHYQAGAP
ncbi:Signal peptidase I W [Arthrobacter sp. SO5]|uniref:LamG-like jellyroll fold domain-containing protein n=1 Tax=Arthrobacter sp. SO5 TaxID=1897055 RepID=UPI001E610729|nr:LamG-like jellyroll fold domain-containing protein [Arthrobacter sp. SO5]MCB5276058.1 Signal peptidase I W [Arthrobacter sp. SO5]